MLEKVQELSKLGSWELDLQQNTLIWSKEVYTIFELEQGSKPPSYEMFLSFVHPDDKERLNEAYQDSLNTKKSYNIEHKIITKKGETRIVKEHAYHLFDYKGNIVKSIGTIHDITELKQYEKQLKKFIDLQDNIVFLSNGHNISYSNQKLLDFFNITKLDELFINHLCICDLFN